MRQDRRREIHTNFASHFAALPPMQLERIKELGDLTPAIELFHTLVQLERFYDAGELFIRRLPGLIGFFRLGASTQSIELLESIPARGWTEIHQRNPSGGASLLSLLAMSYRDVGRVRHSIDLYTQQIQTLEKLGRGLPANEALLSQAYTLAGLLRQSAAWARKSLLIGRNSDFESLALFAIAYNLAITEQVVDFKRSSQRSLKMINPSDVKADLLLSVTVSQHALWSGDTTTALSFADRATKLAAADVDEIDVIAALRLNGEIQLALGQLELANERLHQALTRARSINLMEEQLRALVALAELRRQQGDISLAHEFLDDIWEAAERGPYPLFHTDACNVLAQIERDEGNKLAATKAASSAYRLAWCDGPPYAYHWGLEKAKRHLDELGAPEPQMPPFEESKFDPLPDVEIDPKDKFHVGDRLQ